MSFPTKLSRPFGAEKVTGSAKYYALGTGMELPDGRTFRYALAGGTALSPGKIVAAPVPVANHDMDLVTAVTAIGASAVTVTLGATAATADQYADGYLYTNDGTGEGQIYRVDGHLAIASGGTGAINLDENDKIVVALDGTTLSGLQTSPYSAVVVTPTTVTNRTVGVPATLIAADEYGWVQTKGLASVFVNGTVVLGEPVRVAGATAPGAVQALNRDGTNENEQEVGVVMAPRAVTTHYGFIHLSID